MATPRAKPKSSNNLRDAIKAEWFLGISLATTLAFALFSEKLLDGLSNPLWLAFVFIWLFGVVMASALAVARHADRVAEALGEPYGTLVLTLSVTAIEVMSISAVMLHGENNPTLVRDSLFAIVMIILGGMVGGSLLLGGWKHSEQHYNLQSANAYLGVIIPLTVLTLTLPDFTITTPGPTLSLAQQVFLFVMSIALYGAFLALQTGRHRGYFVSEDQTQPPKLPRADLVAALARILAYRLHFSPVVLLAEQLATPIDYYIETLHAPAALGGVVIAMLVATRKPSPRPARPWPTGCKARSIFRWARFFLIGLAVPAMLAIAIYPAQGLSWPRKSQRRAALAHACRLRRDLRLRPHQVLQGAVHVMLFGAFVMLISKADGAQTARIDCLRLAR